MNKLKNTYSSNDKIVFITLPFLIPLVPPAGISCLKSYLEMNGWNNVKTVDAMSDLELKSICYIYFDTLKNYIPEKQRGNFFNVGLDVLLNHFMAHINYDDEVKYRELVKILVYKNFFVNLGAEQINELIDIVDDFFKELEAYMITLIENEKPKILGLSIVKGSLASAYFAARIIKEKYPQIEIIAGGPIFSQELFPNTPNFNLIIKKAVFIDKIFIGEGEILFLKYLKGELPDKKKIYTLDDIDNELLDLNSTNVPDFLDFDLSEYLLLPAYTSRGCIYKCSFCAETNYWKKYHRKDAEKVADEFEELQKKYDKNIFILTDCLINPIATSLSKELIRRNKEFYWDVYIKVDEQVCSPEITKLWRKAGFYRARLGIESGSERILNIINKKITLDQIKTALYNLASAGIKTTTYWIAGHPGETEEDFQQTLDLLEELKDYIYEAECDPFRYFYTGQVNSEEWTNDGNNLLYPEDVTDMLITQTWQLDAEPKRQEIYERGWRFKEQCKKLNIPNPYSISEIYKADKRWSELHKNAVPPLTSFF